MRQRDGLNRRAFLRSAQMTALVGAAGMVSPADEPADGRFDFDTPYNRFGTDSVKYDRQARLYGKGNVLVGMGIADMDFRCAPAITKALEARVRHECWGYLDMPESHAAGIIAWNKRRYGIDIDPALMVLTDGVHPSLISALRTFSPPGSKVLLLTPTYDGFYGDISFVGCRPEESPLKLDGGRYSIDFEDLERRISHDTNTLILCNPQNPTGNCWPAEDLTRVGEICARRRVVVLADEIHCDFVTKGNRYTPFCTLPDKEIVRNSITFKAASKSFGLAAMKSAWMFSTNEDYMARVAVNHRPTLNTFGIVANQAAYAEGEEWLNQLVEYIDGNHDFTERFIRENMPLVKYTKAQGTYLAWLDVREALDKIGAKELAAKANQNLAPPAKPVTPEKIFEEYLVRHAKIQMNPGTSYGLGGAGHMRMNIATSRKTLEVALSKVAGALHKA